MWIRLQSVDLCNGVDDRPSDSIGVAAQWSPPDVFDGVTVEHLREVQTRIAGGSYGESASATDWAGHVVAEVLGLNLDRPAEKSRAKHILRQWLSSNPPRLRVERVYDSRKGRDRPCIVVGEYVEIDH